MLSESYCLTSAILIITLTYFNFLLFANGLIFALQNPLYFHLSAKPVWETQYRYTKIVHTYDQEYFI
jgi:hypothetical protein